MLSVDVKIKSCRVYPLKKLAYLCDKFAMITSNISGSYLNPLSANPTNWSNTFKKIRRQIADELFECVSPFCEIGA